MTKGSSKKTLLFTRTIPALKEQSAYFSLAVVKRALADAAIDLADPFAQHQIAQPTKLLYAESDALDSVADALKAAGWNAWANPKQRDVERFVHPGEKTVVLRPAISKQPTAIDHVAPIEKALVDILVEAPKLQLMDSGEAQRILDAVLRAGIIQLPVIIGYSEIRGINLSSQEINN